MERRVVITSAAAITPIGKEKNIIMDNLSNGVSGIKNIRDDDVLKSYLKTDVFGSIDYPIEYDFKRIHRKNLGPVGYYACQVAKEALNASGLDQEFISSGRMGVAFGSTHGSPLVEREMFKTFFQEDFDLGKVDPAKYLQTLTHTTAANIASMFNVTGRTLSSCTACTTGSQSIGFGYEAIKYGIQDAMICGAADEYDTMTILVFDKLLASSVKYNKTPQLTPRPFDKNRDGMVVGEGAGAIILEEYEFAKKRGANILAEVIGFASGCNGGNLVNPDVTGVKNTLLTGLNQSGKNPEDVDFISAHATSTNIGDIVESKAIYEVYKDKPLVTGLKSYIGHTMSACGVIETIFVLYMMENKVIFPTLNLEELDEQCEMINHTGEIREKQIQIASIQNFAFGGVNTSLFVKKL
ncbi:MAG: 3-oxoacyl-ACP synthase [Spirochaetota bacterium]|nr:3-oxoacyl-ACP synthase [Spirochaetota bacterium]